MQIQVELYRSFILYCQSCAEAMPNAANLYRTAEDLHYAVMLRRCADCKLSNL